MNKKILGLAGLTAVVAPVAALVSCDFGGSKDKPSNAKTDGSNGINSGSNGGINNGSNGSTNSGTNGSNGGSNGSTGGLNGGSNGLNGTNGGSTGSSMNLSYVNGVQKNELQTQPLTWTRDSVQTNPRTPQFHRVVNKAAADAVDAMVTLMNREADWAWHTVGDAVLDGINAVRYAIKQDALGNKEAKNQLAIFIKNVFDSNDYKEDASKNNEASNYYNLSTNDINEWLGIFGKTQTRSLFPLANDMDHHTTYASKQGNPAKFHSVEEFKNMNPLRLSIDALVRSEYRAQQIEWNGSFDGHDWEQTNTKIKANGVTNSIGIAAPAVRDLSTFFGGENYVFYMEADDSSDARATTAKGFKNNIYEGVMDAVSTLYDNMDASHTTGHRQNFFAPELQTFGYSPVLSDSTNQSSTHSPFLITSNAGSGVVSQVNKAVIDAQIQKLTWTKTALGFTDAQVAQMARNYPSIDDYGIFMHFMSPYLVPGMTFTAQQKPGIIAQFQVAKGQTSRAGFKSAIENLLTTPDQNGSYFPEQGLYVGDHKPTSIDDKLFESLYVSTVSQFVEQGVTGSVSGIYDILGGSVAGIKMEGASAKVTDQEFNKLFGY